MSAMLGGSLHLFDAPTPVQAAGGGLRPYQRDAVEAILRDLREHRSTLLVLATGLGKTVVFGEVAGRWDGRVLVLAHREELLTQARARLQDALGELVGLEQSEMWAGNERVVVASVQTVVNDKRRARFDRNPPTLVIIDEAHHAPAKSYRKIIDAFPAAKVLGVTATPDRGDGKAMGMVFQSTAYRRDIDQGIDDGYLVPVQVHEAFVKELDLGQVSTSKGDLAEGELDDAVAEAVAPIAHVALRECGARSTIIFTPGVRTAHAVAEAINKVRPGSAAAVDGETDRFQRRRVFADLRSGRLQFLVNCGIATEGTDVPNVSCVLIARPTKSRALYVQMIGRGLRVLSGLVEDIDTADDRRAAIAASAKPNALIIDITGKNGDHVLVSPVDVLGGRYDDETRARAKKKIEEGEKDVDQALRAAAREIEALRLKKSAAAAAKARVKYELIARDPFRAMGVSRGEGKHSGEPAVPATSGQRWYLMEKCGLSRDEAGAVSKREAGRLIGAQQEREKAGLCSLRSIRGLAAFGIDARKATEAQVTQLRTEFVANGKRMPSPARIKEILGRVPGQEG